MKSLWSINTQSKVSLPLTRKLKVSLPLTRKLKVSLPLTRKLKVNCFFFLLCPSFINHLATSYSLHATCQA